MTLCFIEALLLSHKKSDKFKVMQCSVLELKTTNGNLAHYLLKHSLNKSMIGASFVAEQVKIQSALLASHIRASES